MTQLMDKVSEFQLRGAVRNVKEVVDKALAIERELGTDILYTLVANGEPLDNIAEALGVSVKEFELIMTRTPEHRNKYIKAKLYKPAMSSLETLDGFSTLSFMDKEQKNASSHHLTMVRLFMEQTNDVSERSSAITVNNVISVNDNQPELPDDLLGVLDVEYVDVGT